MKKPETSQSSRQHIINSKTAYYKGIGESAALYTFTKKRYDTLRLTSLSPRIQNFLRPDPKTRSEKELKILKDLHSRDISHLKDRASSPAVKIAELPEDLDVVKRLVYNSDNFGNPLASGSPLSTICRKEFCLDEMYKSQTPERFTIDRIMLGSPSGRQECENLKKWLENMRINYCSEDSTDENERIIYSMCSKELIRQVSVNCIERGNLLHEVIRYYQQLYEKMNEKLKRLEILNETLRRTFTIEFADKEAEYLEQIADLERIETALKIKLKEKKLKISALAGQLEKSEKIAEELKEKFTINEAQGTKFNHMLKRTISGFSKTSLVIKRPSKIDLENLHINDYGNDLPSPKTAMNYQPENKGFNKYFDTSSPVISEYAECSKGTQTVKPQLEIEKIQLELGMVPAVDEKEEIIIEINDLDANKSGISSNINVTDVEQESFNNRNAKEEPAMLEPPTQRGKKAMRRPTKKELTVKLTEVDKKLAEKENELERISKKIKVKQIELDFLSKTVEYKQLKEIFFMQNGSHPHEITLDQLLQKMPSKKREFNILADNQFWNEDAARMPSKHQVVYNRSSTHNYTKTSDQYPDGKLLTKNAKKRTLNQEKSDSEEEMIFTEEMKEEIQKSMISDLESEKDRVFDEKDFQKNFFKKEITPIKDLHMLVDTNLIYLKSLSSKSSAVRILQKICEKDMDFIKSKAQMSRKLINRLVLSLYLSFFSRHDYSEDFLNFVYFDFYQRYGLKYVSDKKFVEFVCSLILAEDSKKFNNFLRFLGAGQKINKMNLSKKSLEIYLEGLYFLINSKIGVNSQDDHHSDKLIVPVIRAIELIKEKLEKIDRSQINRTVSLIEVRAMADPKKINPNGMIDSEFVLELIVDVYESLKFKYIEGVEFIVNAIKYNEPKDIVMKNEVAIAVRAICPDKLDEVEKYFDDRNIISVEELCYFAVEKSMFNIADIRLFYEDKEKTLEEAESMIHNTIQEMKGIVSEIENTEKFMKTLPQSVWENKVKQLEKGLYERKPYETIFAFKILFLELIRIHTTFL